MHGSLSSRGATYFSAWNRLDLQVSLQLHRPLQITTRVCRCQAGGTDGRHKSFVPVSSCWGWTPL